MMNAKRFVLNFKFYNWFKRFFLPSTGFYDKIRVSSTRSKKEKGLAKMPQFLFSDIDIRNIYEFIQQHIVKVSTLLKTVL